MICPRCGKTLQERVEHGVTIDQCPSCGGVWLDKGELDVLVEADESGLVRAALRRRQVVAPTALRRRRKTGRIEHCPPRPFAPGPRAQSEMWVSVRKLK